MTNRPSLDTFRTRGRQAAKRAAAELAPYDVLQRVAWASGWQQEDCLAEAIVAARAAGIRWSAIAEAVGTAPDVGDTNSSLPDRPDPRSRARRRLRAVPATAERRSSADRSGPPIERSGT